MGHGSQATTDKTPLNTKTTQQPSISQYVDKLDKRGTENDETLVWFGELKIFVTL